MRVTVLARILRSQMVPAPETTLHLQMYIQLLLVCSCFEPSVNLSVVNPVIENNLKGD